MSSEIQREQVVAIIQARLGSVRFPRKVLAELDGRPLVEFMIDRVRQAQTVGSIMVAVPERDLSSEIRDIAMRQQVSMFGGSEQDVLARFADLMKDRIETVVVRLTADCPLIDPAIIDRAVTEFASQGVDYLRTGFSFPDGLDVEVASRKAILEAAERAAEPAEREHVMPWIASNPEFRCATIENGRNLGFLRLTVDEPQDLGVVREVVAALAPELVSLATITDLYDREPQIFAANAGGVRDEGASLPDSQKLWRRAKRAIPGGVSLLSKRPDMHLPDRWPTYFTSAQGCQVTSLDGRRYLDMGMMSVGTSILGYGDPRVDQAVMNVVRQGVVSTLNCPEEVLLAERLIALHPWSDQARFARTGGEACAMAVRIARAAAGKDGVAICGYHGWHDWYLAANLSRDKALDGHLLPGLSTKGVPRALMGTTHAFGYNDLESLREILALHEIGVIVMEVERSTPPVVGFLEGVRNLATEHGVVLVFDESTSGFRQVLGGHHLTVGINPDMAVFGKTLGNGYAISAVLGRDEVMDVARDLFISSTFWSERIGPSAGLASLAAMQEDDAPTRIHQLGVRYRSLLLEALSGDAHLLSFSGLSAITVLGLAGLDDSALLKTFIVSKLLARDFLAGPAFYAALPHERHLEGFVAAMASCLTEATTLGASELMYALDEQPLATVGFARLA